MAFNASPEVIAQARARQKQPLSIWPENWEAVSIFLRLGTQWRFALHMSGGVYLGLDYPAVLELLRFYEVEDMRATFEDIQIMEAAAMKILNVSGEK